MITPSFSLTATERVLPKLALDFTTASLDSRITFSRSLNTATRVNSSGLIETVNADVARFDFNPLTLACRGLLIEETRTNYILDSEGMSLATWTKEAGSITATNAVSPGTTSNACVFTETTSNTTHGARNTNPITAASIGSLVTASVFFRKGTRQHGFLALFNGTDYATIVVDLDTGAVTSTSVVGLTYQTEFFANGAVRLQLTRTQAGSTNSYLYWGTSNSATPTYTSGRPSFVGSTSATIIVWGAQVELGTFATSYIPTTTTALTRNADVATMTGTNFSDWYNATEGTLLAAVSSPNSTCIAFQIDDGTDANFIRVLSRATGASGGSAAVNVGNINQSTFSAFTFAANNKSIMAYKLNDLATTINGGTVSTDTSALIPTVSMVRFGASAAAAFTGTIQKISYYPQRLTNREVQAFSK